MPRPKKNRRVCDFPQTQAFAPVDQAEPKAAVILTVEEYETIRLIDKEGLSQEQCGDFMQIARTTVQQIYADARKKLADVLVDGLPLRIEGGDYQLCSGGNPRCGCSDCYKQKIRQMNAKPKGEATIRAAIPYQSGEIFQHFGQANQFKIYDMDHGSITASEVVDTNGTGHGALTGMLVALKVDALICGGIGGGAQASLAAAGIRLFGGVCGDADAAAEAFAAGTLHADPNARCDHRGCRGDGHPCG